MKNFFLLNVHDIPQEGLHLTTQWDSTLVDEILEDKTQISTICSPLSLDSAFSLLGSKIHLDGLLRIELELNCARCLSSFRWPLETHFRYFFWPTSRQSLAEEKELGQDELEIVYFKGESIDLRPIVREQIYLTIPQYPHCTTDCQGLCPRCGANLNIDSCSCSALDGKTGSPFDVLEKIKKKQSKQDKDV